MRRSWILSLAILVSAVSADTFIDAKQIEPVAPWTVCTDVKGAREGTLLVAPAALAIRELEVNPGLSGPHRIHIGLHYKKTAGDQRYYGGAMHVRLDGETYRVLMESRRPFAEHAFKAADMTNRRIVLATLSERPAAVDYIRFEPLTAAEFAKAETRRAAPHEMDVVGINDVNVWMWLYTTRSEWDFRDTIGQHVHAGFNRVYWMANAGAIFYHTDVGTRYQRDKRGFTPRSGYMVENFRPLESGVKAAHEMGVKILGWYRLNNNFASKQTLAELGPGLNSEFFMSHPEYLLLRANGKADSSKYSFAYPAVRDYVRALCVEMVQKGVDGLMLDLLRHPPLAGYEPPLIDGYLKEHGVDPRRIKPADKAEFARWSAYRARHSFTQFVIDLAAELRRIGKPVPIGLRCSLARFSWNRDNGMDVEDLVKRGLIGELCLMNGYLSRPELLHRPHEIAAAAEPYFRLTKGRDVKLICGLHGRGPGETLTYGRFAHDAGFDGVAIYESDVYATKPDHVRAYRQLKDRLTVAEPWLTASASARDRLIPWRASGAEPGWWQLNLPATRALRELTLRFAGPVANAQVLTCADVNGNTWEKLGSRSDTQEVKLSLKPARPLRRIRLELPQAAGTPPALSHAEFAFTDGKLMVGEQRDGRIHISSHKSRSTVKPGAVFKVEIRGNPSRSNVAFIWDGSQIHLERDAPFTWYTPKTLRPGRHRLKVRLTDTTLSPSVDEIEVIVEGKEPGLGPVPKGMTVVAAQDFEGLPEGLCDELPTGWYFTRGYGKEETRLLPDGSAEVALVGGSRALHLRWPGTGPRMKLHLATGRPLQAGAVEFDFMVPEVRRQVLAGIAEGSGLNLALYLVDNGKRMTYNNGKNSHQRFDPDQLARTGQWRHVRWEWGAGGQQRIYIDGSATPQADGKGVRKKLRRGADSVLFFFFENQPAELYIDNVRILSPQKK